VTILLPSRTTDIVAVGTGTALVGWLMLLFARGPHRA